MSALAVVAAASWLGFADFVVYSLIGVDGRLDVFGLIKGSSWGPSYFMIQLFAFVSLSVVLLCGFLVLNLIMRVLSPRWSFVGVAPLAVAAQAALVLTLRFWKHGDSTLRLVMLCLMSAVAIVLVFFVAHFPGGSDNHRGWRNRALACTVAVATPFCIAFLVAVEPIPLFPSQPDRSRDGKLRPNVLLVVLDTVRADNLGCYGRRLASTPSIDRFAREGVLFENAYAAAPWTVPSHASMFTGLPTGVHRAEWGNTLLGSEFLTLAELLSRNGYLTAGFSENPFIGHSTQMSQGFSAFFEAWRRPLLVRAFGRAAAHAGLYKERLEYAGHTLAVFRKWHRDTSRSGRPFFAYLNVMAAHLPRYPRSGSFDEETLRKIQPVNLVPEKFYLPEYELDDSALSTMRSIYDEEVEYLDEIVGDLREYLEESGVFDQTIVIITSDHGENFGEHGYIEHQFCLYEQLIHVPLILRYPSTLRPRRVSETVSTIALTSTVANLLGKEVEKELLDTRPTPLHEVTEDQVVVAESSSAAGMLRTVIDHLAPAFDYFQFDRSISSVIVGDHKLIVDSKGLIELYNLTLDPNEENNIASVKPDTVRLLSGLYTSPLLSVHGVGESATGIEMDPETLDALRALGYIR